jgi:hypothetical protein
MKAQIRTVRGVAVGICLLSAAAILVGATRSDAQGVKQGAYVTQAAARLAKLVDSGNGAGFALANNSFSLGGGWLKKSEKWISIYSVNLVEGKKYRFLASGDDDAKDVDLRVMDSDGNQVAIDQKIDLNAVVDYIPAKTGKYLVQIRLFNSNSNYDAVVLSAMMIKK